MSDKDLVDGKARTNRSLFGRETNVSILIDAKQSVIWKILTNGDDFARWNSTILSLKGELKLNSTFKIKSNLDLEKKNKYKVTEFQSPERMVWCYGNVLLFKSRIIYTITPDSDGKYVFTMNEKLYGSFAPLILGYIPDFDETFSQFALDLKTEAEIIQKANNLLTSLKK
jgi:hypothetical protein